VDARPKAPDEIFGTHIRYVVPPFQRLWVWEEENPKKNLQEARE